MSKAEIKAFEFTYDVKFPLACPLRKGVVYARTKKAALAVFFEKLGHCKPEILSVKRRPIKMEGAEPTLITYDEAS